MKGVKSDIRTAFNLVESIQTIKTIHFLWDSCIHCFIEVKGILILRTPKMAVVPLSSSCQSGKKLSTKYKQVDSTI